MSSLVALSLGLTCSIAVPMNDFPPNVPVAETVTSVETRFPPSISARSLPGGRWQCAFTFTTRTSVERVMLAGSFNNWSDSLLPMTRNDDGVYEVNVILDDGVHTYKFVHDGVWLSDPKNDDHEHDGHGGRNSVVRIGAVANIPAGTASRGDGFVDAIGLEHSPGRAQYLQPLDDLRRLVRYRTLANDASKVTLVTEEGSRVPMHSAVRTNIFEWWEAATDALNDGVRYTFLFEDGDLPHRDPNVYRAAVHADNMRTPDWAKDAIWYQIMVDRFRNGAARNNPNPVRPWTSEWFTPSDWEEKSGQAFYDWYVFSRLYGGDLQGLRSKLGYLRDLGVNALYLNPVFQSPSHHKYNATSFIHIDEHYGGGHDYAAAEAREDLLDPTTWTWTESDRLFLDFLREAKAMGFRVIIDGVFNHVGTDHPAFRDVAENGRESPFADWFEVTSWDPFEYQGWAGFGELPVFRKTSDGLASDSVKRHIFDITSRWMDPDGDGDPSDGIDGWRLDVPNEVAMPFWVEWCAHVRSINPDAYITGEIWDRAEAWLDGSSFDAVMNYQFAEVAYAWIGDRTIKANEAEQRFAELRMAYPIEATAVLQNLIDSHDTDRAVSNLFNPGLDFDAGNRAQENSVYNNDKPDVAAYQRLRLLAFLQMTYVGAPMIYYGDEAGMWGADDPTNRKPMLWKDLEPYEHASENFVMEDHLAYYQSVVKLRRDHVALRRGTIRNVVADAEANVWVFLRETAEERVLVAINASDEYRVVQLPTEIGPGWSHAFGLAPRDTPRFPSIGIPAVSGRAWVGPATD